MPGAKKFKWKVEYIYTNQTDANVGTRETTFDKSNKDLCNHSIKIRVPKETKRQINSVCISPTATNNTSMSNSSVVPTYFPGIYGTGVEYICKTLSDTSGTVLNVWNPDGLSSIARFLMFVTTEHSRYYSRYTIVVISWHLRHLQIILLYWCNTYYTQRNVSADPNMPHAAMSPSTQM